MKVLVYVVLLLGNLMESPMGQPHVIAPHVVGTEFFGHTVILMRISRRKGETRAYVRGDAMLEFHFCPKCGCMAFWRGLRRKDETGKTRIAVNLRLSEPTAVAHIPIDHFDGLDTFDKLPRDGKCVSDYWF